MAAGAVDGTTTLLRLVDGLAVIQSNEKATVNQMFERETRREKNLETQGKEARAFSLANIDSSQTQQSGHNTDTSLLTLLNQVESEFNNIVSQPKL